MYRSAKLRIVTVWGTVSIGSLVQWLRWRENYFVVVSAELQMPFNSLYRRAIEIPNTVP